LSQGTHHSRYIFGTRPEQGHKGEEEQEHGDSQYRDPMAHPASRLLLLQAQVTANLMEHTPYWGITPRFRQEAGPASTDKHVFHRGHSSANFLPVDNLRANRTSCGERARAAPVSLTRLLVVKEPPAEHERSFGTSAPSYWTPDS